MDLTPEQRRQIYEEDRARIEDGGVDIPSNNDAASAIAKYAPSMDASQPPYAVKSKQETPSGSKMLINVAALSLVVAIAVAGYSWLNSNPIRPVSAPNSAAPTMSPEEIRKLTSSATGGESVEWPVITLATYERLETGMSYERTVKILGTNGIEQSRSEVGGIVTVMYAWQAPTGGNMNAMFQNGRLISKAQFGLQ